MEDEAYHSGNLEANVIHPRTEQLDSEPDRLSVTVGSAGGAFCQAGSSLGSSVLGGWSARPLLSLVLGSREVQAVVRRPVTDTSSYSPTSDYGSGSFPSLSDKKPPGVEVCGPQGQGEKGKVPSSPSPPMVGENVEVATDEQERKLRRPSAGRRKSKRAMGPSTDERGKVPRLGAIRMSTIQTPVRERGKRSEASERPKESVFRNVTELSKSDRTGRPSEAHSALDPERVTAGCEGEKRERPGLALLHVSEAHLAILPDEDGDTALHIAVAQEKLSLTKYLVGLITGVSMNLDIANHLRQTPLHISVVTRQQAMVEVLILAGASVNFPDRKGNTCIHLATLKSDVAILQLLSKSSRIPPNYNAQNFSGLTAVHIAAREAFVDVLRFLFEMGADKNSPDTCSGRTPLHYAVEAQHFSVVNFLLESGCNVNAATFAGNTPLHIAAGRKLKEIVALLMAYGANPAIANGEGDLPSDLPPSLLMQHAKMNST